MSFLSRLFSRPKPDSYFDAVIQLRSQFRVVIKLEIEAFLEALGVSSDDLAFRDLEGLATVEYTVIHPDFQFSVRSVRGAYRIQGLSPKKLAQRTNDLLISAALREHRAWISCNVTEDCPRELRQRSAEIITSISSFFIDQNSLLFWDANSDRVILPTEKAIEMLRSGDRQGAFDTVSWEAASHLKPGQIADEIEEARRRFPEFVRSFNAAEDKSAFMVKASFATDSGGKEHMWVQPETVSELKVTGILLNDPFDISALQPGSAVDFSLDNLSDWTDGSGREVVGMFTEPRS